MSQSENTLLKLRQLVLDGDLKPGERVLELQLCRDLNVSRTPVRYALLKLEEEGLLEALPSVGYVVRRFSEDDFKDAIDLRGMVEGAAARKAAEARHKPGRLATIANAVMEMDAVMESPVLTDKTFTRYVEFNRVFHEQLLELADSFVIRRMHERATSLPFASPNALVSAQVALPSTHNLIVVAQHQHRNLLMAIENGEGARAERIAREHAHLAHSHLTDVIRWGDGKRGVAGAALLQFRKSG